MLHKEKGEWRVLPALLREDRSCPPQHQNGMSVRVRKKGFTCWWTPNNVIIHLAQGTPGFKSPLSDLKQCLKWGFIMTGSYVSPEVGLSVFLLLGLSCFRNTLKSLHFTLHQNETKCQNLRIFHKTESLFPGQPYYWTLIWYNMCPYLHTWSTALTHV